MLRSVLLTALIAFSASVSAQGFDYNYVSVGYSQVDIDSTIQGATIDGDALGLGGSYGLNDDIFAFGSFQDGELEEPGDPDNIDVTVYDIGFGYRMPMSDTVDFVTTLSYEYMELSEPGLSVDESGLGIGVGIRANASDTIELNAGIQYVDLGTVFGDDTSFAAGVLYSLTESIDIGLNGNWGDDVSQYTLSGRFYFGK
ncbi:MAG: outer membrane beta-barrel protein [Woeseia sp.]